MIQPSPERLNASRRRRLSRVEPLARRASRRRPSGSRGCSTPARGAPRSRRGAAIASWSARAVVAQPVVERAEAVGPVALQRHPDLERVQPSRALEAAHSLVPAPLAVCAVEEVGRALAERRVELALVARRGRCPPRAASASSCAGPRRSSAPARCPRSAPAVRRREERRGAVGAVDVQPDPALLAQPADRVEVVERAGRGRARGRDHRHHAAARAPAGASSSAASAADVHPEAA